MAEEVTPRSPKLIVTSQSSEVELSISTSITEVTGISTEEKSTQELEINSEANETESEKPSQTETVVESTPEQEKETALVQKQLFTEPTVVETIVSEVEIEKACADFKLDAVNAENCYEPDTAKVE